MTAEVVSLAGARVERGERLRAYIDKTIASEVAKSSEKMEHYFEWLRMKPEERSKVADYLAAEIVVRYEPIARQFRNALYDGLVLYIASAEEAGKDLTLNGLLLGLSLMMQDERYIKILSHFVRANCLKETDESVRHQLAADWRAKDPSPIDNARDSLFETYTAMRKK